MADIAEKNATGEKLGESPTLEAIKSPASDIESTTVNERAFLRKLDWKLLPAVSILYLLSFLDRSNVANARIDGLTTGKVHCWY
jgi:hypothetical protein